MERPIFKPIGVPSRELDTPALVVDLDALESNISNFHSRFERSDVKVRPYLQSHLSPAIAHMQIRAPRSAEGIAVSTLGQAETFAQRGFDDILITNLAVTGPKMARVAALAKRVDVKIGADNPKNIADLAAVAISSGSEIGVVIVVRDGSDLIGAPSSDVLELVRLARDTTGTRLAGLMSRDQEPLSAAAANCSDTSISLPMVALIEPDGDYAAGGGSGITEIVAGTYALMDAASLDSMPDLRPAAKILTTVMTHQDEGLVWLDAGQKATSIDTGLPSVDGIPGASVSRMSAEHGGMVLEQAASWDIDLGSKVWLIPHNIANTVNVYDFIHAIRNDKLEAVWEVAARGRYD